MRVSNFTILKFGKTLVHFRAAKLEEDRCKTMEENLKVREAAVANIQDTYEKRLKEQTRQWVEWFVVQICITEGINVMRLFSLCTDKLKRVLSWQKDADRAVKLK